MWHAYLHSAQNQVNMQAKYTQYKNYYYSLFSRPLGPLGLTSYKTRLLLYWIRTDFKKKKQNIKYNLYLPLLHFIWLVWHISQFAQMFWITILATIRLTILPVLYYLYIYNNIIFPCHYQRYTIELNRPQKIPCQS